MKFKNIIICSYAQYAELKARNYNKEIMADRSCPSGRWYYFSKLGQMRTVINNEVWTSIVGADEWPTGFITRIR